MIIDVEEWVEIGPSGAETLRRGEPWADAPKHPKGDLRWMIREDGAGTAVAPVLFVTKRHRAERGRGRWMDPGEAYTDPWLVEHARRAPCVREGWGAAPSAPCRRRGGRDPWWQPLPDWSRRTGSWPALPTEVYKGLSGEG